MRTGLRKVRILAKLAREARIAALDNPEVRAIFIQRGRRKLYKKPKPRGITSGLSGAATRIRTGDLILTKDVLYQLSHSSKVTKIFLHDSLIITNKFGFVNTFLKNICI